MQLKVMSFKLLPWQPDIAKLHFQFLLLDNYLKIETLIRNISFIGLIIVTELQIFYSCLILVILI